MVFIRCHYTHKVAFIVEMWNAPFYCLHHTWTGFVNELSPMFQNWFRKIFRIADIFGDFIIKLCHWILVLSYTYRTLLKLPK